MPNDCCTTVVIEEKSFMSILVAAVEAFPSKFKPNMTCKPKGVSAEGEVHGLLFGQKIEKAGNTVFNVTLAVPNQIVYERGPSHVLASSHHIDCIRELIDLFPNYQFLGFFHSHPDRSAAFKKGSSVEYSKTDKKSALEAAKECGEDLIEVIFGITYLKQRSRIQPEFIGSNVIHNCCGNYKYSLACYLARDDMQEDSLLDVDNLICATASGMQQVDFK